MAGDKDAEYSATWQIAHNEFTKAALTAISSTPWCNNYFVQPYGGGTVAIAFGSSQALLLPNGNYFPSFKISSTVLIDKATVATLCVHLQQFANISEKDLEDARARIKADNAGKPA